jgi:hypothetical protein
VNVSFLKRGTPFGVAAGWVANFKVVNAKTKIINDLPL